MWEVVANIILGAVNMLIIGVVTWLMVITVREIWRGKYNDREN